MTQKQKAYLASAFSILLASGLLHADVTTNLPTTVTGGSGTVSSLQINDGVFYTAAKGNTINIGGFSAVGGAITSVVLHVEFTVEAGYSGTSAVKVNGINTPIIPTNGDSNRAASVNITGGSFLVDTWPEITSLAVTFNNSDGGAGQAVRFDYAYLEITHATPDYTLPTWSDEFDGSGPPNPAVWTFEQGFVRNEELQWYSTNNAWQENGNLIIEGRREQVLNPDYNPNSSNWRENRQYAQYTSSSIISQNKYSFQYGRMQVRAKIPCYPGSWPAIWTLGVTGEWPSCGECDVLEYYAPDSVLANVARGTTTRWSAWWDVVKKPVSTFTPGDPNWRNEYHVWTMQWDAQNIRLYIDNHLMNTTPQTSLVNPTTQWGPLEPFKQPHFLLLNLALGSNGGDPSGTTFPLRYQVDYVRVWEGATNNTAPTDISLSADSLADNLPIGTVVGYLTATDSDPAEVIAFSLVAGTGSADNGLFEVTLVSGETRTSVLKTKAVLSRQDAATRSIRVRATDIEGLIREEALTIHVLGASVANLAPANVTNSQATLNAVLDTGNAAYSAFACWGTTNGGTNAGAWTSTAYVGAWTNAASTNISHVAGGLAEGQTYYYTFRVTNAAQSTWATNIQSFTTPASPSNALLTHLLPSLGTLTPGFTSATFSYSSTVPYSATNLTVTPTAANGSANITVNGSPVANGTPSAPIPLSVGTNLITTVVVSENLGVTNTYTLSVWRTGNAGLSNLAISAGTILPAFATATFDYTATVPFSTASLTVTPTADDPAVSIKVNGSPAVSGSPFGPVSLVVGPNVISTVVVSADASATNTYALTVMRQSPGPLWWDGGTTNIAGFGDGSSAGGAGTWDTTVENWDMGSNLVHLAWHNANNDLAVFGGTAANVTLATDVTASGLRFDTANYVLTNGTITLVSIATITANANATIASALAGTNGLTKTGGGTLNLRGVNNYSGGTVVSAGTLSFTSNTNLGLNGTRNISVNGTATITGFDGASLGQFSVSTGAVANISGNNFTNVTTTGSGTLAFTAAGIKTLNLGNASSFNGTLKLNYKGNHNYVGATAIAFSSLGDGVGSALQIESGQSDSNQGVTIAYNGTNALTFTNRQVQILQRTGGNWEMRDNILANNSANAAHTWVIKPDLLYTGGQSNAGVQSGRNFILSGSNTGNNEFAGRISNGVVAGVAFNVQKTGTGTWALAGTNSHTGETRLAGGRLNINSAGALGNGTFVISGSGLVFDNTSGAAISNMNNNPIFWGNDTTFIGSSPLDMGTGTVNLAGNRNLTIGGRLTVGGAITNIHGINKLGTGTLILSGANTYSDVTTVSAGMLLINGDATGATNALNVLTNATLGGIGIIGGNTTISNSGRLEFAISTAPASHDELELAAGKSLTFGGASVLTLTSSGSSAMGTYVLLTAPGGISGSVPAAVNLPVGWTASAPTIADGTNLVINITSVGGPATPSPSLLTNSVTGDGTTLSLSWLAGQGWRLQEQTNALSVGIGTNWVYLTDSSVSSTNITVDKTKPTTFYRLVYP